ncbi:acetyltransferase [Legionella worsleiensis]|uniref:Chloramphenicol acetyltransferase n=1 Tax=Legionella worsleiensis TaxID=45076 RepID=A0A0W1A397_9GAMM|nr:acetyltransferase [Legionella worsleiensis]KTD75852.1 chloramphenicol acetyltransferase [Legionella worsleiensis]STY32865.1 acetyltransferase [Legionella worsleiensis]
MHTKLKIIGCGGHSKVVLDALSLDSRIFEISLCDSNKELLGRELAGYLIDSTMDDLSDYDGLAHVAIGNNQVRFQIIQSIVQRASLFTVIHPDSTVAKSSHVESGTFIAARAILGPDSVIGRGSIINHGAIVDHEVVVGSCSHIAPNSTLGGRVTIGSRVLIGAGSVILPGVCVGDDAIIGAGAVVVKDVQPNTTVKGVPAV